jgi:spore germination protein GerM
MKNSKNIIILILSLLGVIILISAVILSIKGAKLTDKNSVTVYFVRTFDTADFRLTPVRRKISPDKSRISTAMTELLKGPSEKEKKAGFYTEIPSATKLIEIKESPKSVIINLSKSFESGGGSTSMIMRLEQLINTALDSVKNKPVFLELDGKKADVIGGEGLIVPQPLSRNLSGK